MSEVADKSEKNRTVSVVVRLRPDLHARLSLIAERRGFPVSTLLAVVAGEFVDATESELQIRRITSLEAARMRTMRAEGTVVGQV